MTADWAVWLQNAGAVLGYVMVLLGCLIGTLLSCLSISGTWLIVAAALGAMLVRWGRFPGLPTVGVFVLVSVAVEVMEALAGSWGVAQRGGSKLAGFMALVGGLAGLLAGSLIPVPVIGGLLGMLAGSFALVFVVERNRLKHSGQAAGIAWGAVTARMLVILVKVVATLGMAAYLLWGLAR